MNDYTVDRTWASDSTNDLWDCGWVVATPEKQRCWIQDCPNEVTLWMVSEMAPGRTLVYGVCEKDAAMIHMAEFAAIGD